MERIRILHCLRVYSTYVRKQGKTRIRFFRVENTRKRENSGSDSFGFVPFFRIRFFRVEITGKREILGSDSFGFVPFFRIRSDSFRLVEFYGVRGDLRPT